MNVLNIIVPILAGLIGGVAGIYLHGRITKDVKILLAFSGAYLLALSTLHLLPEIYEHLGRKAGYYILIGFVLQIIMDFFSKGVEHGHIHHSDKLTKVFPYGIYISLFIHSLIEGMPLSGGEELHAHHHHDTHTNALLAGIAIHKIPEAIALAALLYHFFEDKKKVMLYILVYTLATPIGVALGAFALNSTAADPAIVYAIILAIAVGIFIHVATTIIFEADEHHQLSWRKVIAILLGFGLVLFL